MRKSIRFIFMLLGMIVLAACSSPAVSTPLPTQPAAELQIPTVVSTNTPETAVTNTPLPTATVKIEPTTVPTTTPEPTPTQVPTPVLSIDEPTAGSVLLPGELTFTGEISPMPETPPSFSFSIANQEIITGPVTLDTANGQWHITVTLTNTISGPASMNVVGPDAVMSTTYIVGSAPDADAPVVTLARTTPADMIVAGYTVLLSGNGRNLIDETLTIQVLAQSCTDSVANVSFPLTGGDWDGQLIIPKTATPGPACVIAYTGTRGTGVWHEARLPITIVPEDDPAALLLAVGNPQEDVFPAGRTAEIYGVAVNAPDNEVQVTLAADNPDGSPLLLGEGTAVADVFGYWSIQFSLPADFAGPATLLVTIGEGDTYSELRLPLSVAR